MELSLWSWYSVVSTVTWVQAGQSSSNCSRCKRFSSSLNQADQFWGPVSLLFSGYKVLSLVGGVMWLSRDFHHSPLSGTRVKNDQINTSVPNIWLNGMGRDSFTLIFPLMKCFCISVWTAEIIMLRRKFVQWQNKIRVKYTGFVLAKCLFSLKNKVGRHWFLLTVMFCVQLSIFFRWNNCLASVRYKR